MCWQTEPHITSAVGVEAIVVVFVIRGWQETDCCVGPKFCTPISIYMVINIKHILKYVVPFIRLNFDPSPDFLRCWKCFFGAGKYNKGNFETHELAMKFKLLVRGFTC
jgi:hypothetical protein